MNNSRNNINIDLLIYIFEFIENNYYCFELNKEILKYRLMNLKNEYSIFYIFMYLKNKESKFFVLNKYNKISLNLMDNYYFSKNYINNYPLFLKKNNIFVKNFSFPISYLYDDKIFIKNSDINKLNLNKIGRNIHKLFISNCYILEPTIENINFNNIITISLCFNDQLNDDNLKYLSKINEIDLTGCNNISQVNCLKNVKKLCIADCKNIKNIDSLNNIEILNVAKTNINNLGKNMNNKILILHGCNFINDSDIHFLINIKILDLSNIFYIKNINSLINVERLDISDCCNIKEINISTLKKLKYLNMDNISQKININNLNQNIIIYDFNISLDSRFYYDAKCPDLIDIDE